MLELGKLTIMFLVFTFVVFPKDNIKEIDIDKKLNFLSQYLYENFYFSKKENKAKFLINQKKWKNISVSDCRILYDDVGARKSFEIYYKKCLEDLEKERYKFLLNNYLCKNTQMSNEQCYDKKNFDQALYNYKQYLLILKNSDELTKKTLTKYNDIAYYLQKAGANKEAVYLLEKIIKKFPNRTVAYINLGDAYWALGEKEKAKKAYTTYIEQMCNKGLQKKIPQEVLKRVEKKDVCK